MPRRSSFVASVLALLSCLLSGAWAQDCAEGYGATVRLSAALERHTTPYSCGTHTFLAPRSPTMPPSIFTLATVRMRPDGPDYLRGGRGLLYAAGGRCSDSCDHGTSRPPVSRVCLAGTVGWRGGSGSYSVTRSQDEAAGVLPPTTSLGSSAQIELSNEFVNSLADNAGGAMDDGVLTPEELQSDPEGQALLAALQQQIADQMGVDPSRVQIEGLNVEGSGRRLQQGGKLAGWAFCPTVESCTVDVAYQ